MIILAPDLTGACRGKAAFGLNNWSIPSGILEIDLELARELKDSGLFNVEVGTYLSSPALKQLGLDHNVHSIEIQLTFIKFLSGGK